MIDYFKSLINNLWNDDNNLEIVNSSIVECEMTYTFDIFKQGISDEVRHIYNHYKKFLLQWEDKTRKLNGSIYFVPYEDLVKEHKEMCEIAESLEEDFIEEQDKVTNDLKNWYPIFKFPNGDAFCYDIRTGKIVFFEHEVLDGGINLHGLIIADSIDSLFEKWSEILFVDIYDWSEVVSEHGIDLGKLKISNNFT